VLWVGEVGLLVSRNVIFVLLGFFAMAPGMWGFAGYKCLKTCRVTLADETTSDELPDCVRTGEASEAFQPQPRTTVMNLVWVSKERTNAVLPSTIDHRVRGDLESIKHLQRQCDTFEQKIVLWYDSHLVEQPDEAVKRLQTAMGCANFSIRDIRSLKTVADHPEAFAAEQSFYFRIDLLKVLVCLHELAQGYVAAGFTDFSIEPMAYNDLLDDETVDALKKTGVVLAKNKEGQSTPYENSWMMFSAAQPDLLYAVWDGYVARLLLAAQQAGAGLPQQWASTPEVQRKRRGKRAGPEMNCLKGGGAFAMWDLLLKVLPFIDGEERFTIEHQGGPKSPKEPAGDQVSGRVQYRKLTKDQKVAFLCERNKDEAACLFEAMFGLTRSAICNDPGSRVANWPTKEIGIPDMAGVYA